MICLTPSDSSGLEEVNLPSFRPHKAAGSKSFLPQNPPPRSELQRGHHSSGLVTSVGSEVSGTRPIN